MQAIKLFSIVNALIITGCASISDIENLQSRINSLKAQIPNLNTSVTNSKLIIDKANTQAVNADTITNRAKQKAIEANFRTDELFKRSWKD
ncbi:murein lipoprotein [uncultured bacterium]|nr:murein lipoprotein [uncultured bacterium]